MVDITKMKNTEKEIRDSEEEYRLLFETMLEGYAYCKMIYDKNNKPIDFIYLKVNPAFEKLTGLKNVVGRKVTEIIPLIKDENPEIIEIYNKVATTKKNTSFETYIVSLGIWLSISVYYPQKGYFVAVFDDITERKKEEEELKMSQKIAGVGRWNLDIIKNKLTWSPGIYELFGLDPKKFDATYETFLNSVHPDDRDLVNKSYTTSLKDKKPYDIVHRLVRPNGEVLYVRETCETIYNKEGKPITSMGVVQNITKIKEAEDEIKSMSRFPLENPNPVLRINSKGIVIYANPASEQFLEDIKTKSGMVIPEFIKKPLFDAIISNKTMTIEKEIKGKNFMFSIVPILNMDYANIYGLDITHLKK